MYTVEDIVAKACAYLPATAEPEIRKAYEYAARMHDGQQRLSGLPYIQHPLAVADLVATLRLDTTSICAALAIQPCGIARRLPHTEPNDQLAAAKINRNALMKSPLKLPPRFQYNSYQTNGDS